MKTFTAIVERDPNTKFYVGYVPGFPGAHSQGESLDELQENLREVIEMLLEVFVCEVIPTDKPIFIYIHLSKQNISYQFYHYLITDN